MKRRMLTCLLLLFMLMTLLPAAAFAEALPDEIQAEDTEFAEEYPEETVKTAEEDVSEEDQNIIELSTDFEFVPLETIVGEARYQYLAESGETSTVQFR